MGFHSHQHERLVLIAVAVILIGVGVVGYFRIAAKLAEDGTELSRLGHVGVFALSMVIAPVSVLLFGLVLGALAWLVDFVSRRVIHREE